MEISSLLNINSMEIRAVLNILDLNDFEKNIRL